MATLTSPVSISHENEHNPWLAAAARFDEAASRLRLDDGIRKVLGNSAKEITVHIPVQLDDGRLEVFTGYRVQHSIARGPAKGGIRFAPDVTLDEVREAVRLLGADYREQTLKGTSTKAALTPAH